jgi:hypothetical protein
MTWIGRKKIAFIPLYRNPNIPPDQIPNDWPDKILQRVLYDPNPITNLDHSLRTYIQKVSSGRADLDVVVLPMITFAMQNGPPNRDVPPDFYESQLGNQLRSQGFDAACLVMLGQPPTGETIGFWCRFDMSEALGVWAMETMHSLTGFADLYPFGGNMGAFDEMACNCGTHPSAYTKAAIGWLDASAIAVQSAYLADYQLYSVGLIQPPPSGWVAAVRIGSSVPYLMIEARQRVDQFDEGVPSEGVIVYRVQTSDPLGWAQNATAPVELLTTTALQPGQSYTAPSGASVQVESAIVGGYAIHVTNPADPRCADIRNQIAALDAEIKETTDLQTLKMLRRERSQLEDEAHQLGCPP